MTIKTVDITPNMPVLHAQFKQEIVHEIEYLINLSKRGDKDAEFAIKQARRLLNYVAICLASITDTDQLRGFVEFVSVQNEIISRAHDQMTNRLEFGEESE